MPAPRIAISIEPDGSIIARGATDHLSAALMRHAGFTQITEGHGREHRLPTTTAPDDRATIASHAADMLRAARYSVELGPDLNLDTGALTTPTDPHGVYRAGAQVLRITDQILGAATGAAAAQAVTQLLGPTDGVLIRLQEALAATAEQVADLDDEAYELADRFTAASEQLSTVSEELADAVVALESLHSSSPPSRMAATTVARAVSPALRQSGPRPGVPGTGPQVPPPAGAAHDPSPRMR